MKNLIFILSIFIFSFSFSQNKSADTAQVVIPNRVNSTLAKEKPYLIFISTDGFRYDYAKKYNAENLLKFSNQKCKSNVAEFSKYYISKSLEFNYRFVSFTSRFGR
jgi:predicted AlkP superfamily pyrophosphatase or phosphodiesterase